MLVREGVVWVGALAGGLLLLATVYLPFSCKGQAYTRRKGMVSGDVCDSLPFRVPVMRRPTFPSCAVDVITFKTRGSKGFLGAGTVGRTVGTIRTGNKNGIIVPRKL